jgi:predicted metal-binding transcription factor (methanogenesis marker protein 9)
LKSINTYFTSKKQLSDFIVKNNIIDSEKLLIQVFSALHSKEEIQNILDALNHFWR